MTEIVTLRSLIRESVSVPGLDDNGDPTLDWPVRSSGNGFLADVQLGEGEVVLMFESDDQKRRHLSSRLIADVAEVYRSHPAAPTKAVAEHFNVRPRQASNYVKAAELAGFLPTTTQGKKRR